MAATPRIHDAAKQLREDLGQPSKIILGVDRLDYTKGIDVRLRAFGELLAEGDPAVENAVMVQIATPSRERLGSYKRMREAIEQQVGSLNGDYGRIGHPAVHYLHQSLPREELAAFYVAADVMTVTPLRDGMNLVAKEYVACRVDGGGVLLLSRVHRRRQGTAGRPAGEPVRHRRGEGRTAGRADHASGGGPAADALAAPTGAHP